jgi:hypothetical protein
MTMTAQAATQIDTIANEMRLIANQFAADGDPSFSLQTDREGARRLFALQGQLEGLWQTAARGNPYNLDQPQNTVLLNTISTILREYGDSILGRGDGQAILAAADTLDGIAQSELDGPPPGGGPGGEANDLVQDLLNAALAEQDPSDKADLIRAAMALLDDGMPTTPTPGGPAPPPGATPPGTAPAAPRTLSGDDLAQWLRAEGGTVERDGEGFGVGNGARRVDRAGTEVDRGQALFFQVPPDAGEIAGATVNLSSFYQGGPDGRFTELATVVARDAQGRIVGEYDVHGNPDGKASVTIEQPFATLELRPVDNGGRRAKNSDFVLDSITLTPAAATAATAPAMPAPGGVAPQPGQPQPTPAPTPGTPETAPATPGAAGPQAEKLDLVMRLLRAALAEQDPSDKADLIRGALALLDDMAGAGAPSPAPAPGPAPDPAPAPTPTPTPEAAGPHTLSVDGNTVDTGRYEIRASHHEVVIHDRHTNTSVRAWGDPHFHTGDGDKAQFHDQALTLDLQDGTKVTIKPTARNEDGLAFIDSVAITQGGGAVTINGVHTGDIAVSDVLEGQAAQIDQQFADGTVLEAGEQVDDLWFTDANGDRTEELVGDDPTQRFNEHMLDGRGGASDLGVETAGSGSGGPISAETMALLEQLLGMIQQVVGDTTLRGQMLDLVARLLQQLSSQSPQAAPTAMPTAN